MNNILSKVTFVKRKIQEVGEEPCYQCIFNVQYQNQGVVFPTSIDINVKMDHKNDPRGILANRQPGKNFAAAHLFFLQLQLFRSGGGSPCGSISFVGGFLTSMMNLRYFLNINLAYDHKNAVGVILMSLNREKCTPESKKSTFSPVLHVQDHRIRILESLKPSRKGHNVYFT